MMPWLLLAVLLILGVWEALRFLPAGVEAHNVMPYGIALIRFLWIPAVLCALWAALIHQWWELCAALILGLLCVCTEFLSYRGGPSGFPSRDPSHDNRMNVMTLNCRFGRASAEAIVDAVATYHIDVLALQELTPGLVEELNDLGLRESLPHHSLGASHNDDNGGFNGVWMRVQPVAVTPTAIAIPAAEVPGITVALPNTRELTFVSAHTKSPMRGCREWSMGIITLSELAKTTPSEGATVIMGDLNSNVAHPSFRALLAAGFSDASGADLRRPVSTYPSWLRWPRIELDHILATKGITFRNVRSLTIPGSDHLALMATVAI